MRKNLKFNWCQQKKGVWSSVLVFYDLCCSFSVFVWVLLLLYDVWNIASVLEQPAACSIMSTSAGCSKLLLVFPVFILYFYFSRQYQRQHSVTSIIHICFGLHWSKVHTSASCYHYVARAIFWKCIDNSKLCDWNSPLSLSELYH
jgi:hypothetical protein